ncbi:uncharacterized protein SAPINGB_P004124 [Magnusiomyces paraingens]|uniref:Histidine biosynthesis trifunctional protein n=1 Tax=Magnusiomyces paraingens TaxID=2606893 RepID=A0A5E8C0A9_9ASCO|nr:uncharacterized protein SAPINGB_P004124 [Saprochaete ingens]VVT54535.1 unnamed protein product [Saprochaete ingens]
MSFPLLPKTSFAEISSAQALAKPIGQLLITLTPTDDLSKVSTYIKTNFGTLEFYVDISTLEESVDSAIKLLDAGVYRVIVTPNLAADLVSAGVSPLRILAAAPASTNDQDVSGFVVTDTSSSSSSSSSSILSAAKDLAKKLIPETGGAKHLYVSLPDSIALKDATAIVAASATPIVSAAKLTREHAADKIQDKLPVAEFILTALSSDRPDGLFTTLVLDENQTALGLVYSSPESVKEALRTNTGVYQSRRHGLWYKGATSGATQTLLSMGLDCDGDCLKVTVSQQGPGFCHNNTASCFGAYRGLLSLEQTLRARIASAPEGSYTKRLFNDEKLLTAKILEEAEELATAKTKDEVSWEAADLLYFAFAKVVKEGVSVADVMNNLDSKSYKISRRRGDAKPKYVKQVDELTKSQDSAAAPAAAAPAAAAPEQPARIKMNCIDASSSSPEEIEKVLTRPVQKTSDIMKLVLPIINNVIDNGDKALLEYAAKFEKVELKTPVINAPFSDELMKLPQDVKDALDLSISNVEKFHAAQLDESELRVETVPGVICSRFARPIESVGLYIPGGTAVLPSTALMLGVPAKVAGCKNIIFASPPRRDGTITPEIVYVAHKVGAKKIVLAGGAQAVAAMAYGTESVPKVDKIMGPGNQFVTAAKMHVQNDTRALVSIDMPAGPSEVLVVADKTANPAFVASDLLSQAEHGVDSQVILLAVDLTDAELEAIDEELEKQALALPRVDIVRGSIAHSTTLRVKTHEQAMALSNQYAPEHLILQIADASTKWVKQVEHAGSVFLGPYSPESCGDYSSGTNHTLPTYGYAKMYSGVNTGTFMKHITSQELTEEGLKAIGPAVMTVAAVEGLDGHKNAVKVRLDALN